MESLEGPLWVFWIILDPITMGVIILGLIGNFLSVWVLSSTASSRFI